MVCILRAGESSVLLLVVDGRSTLEAHAMNGHTAHVFGSRIDQACA